MRGGCLPPVLIDDRERLPYFIGKCGTIEKRLKTGDYSLLGYEDFVTIERKSLPDAYNSVTKERFYKEMVRLSRFRCAALIIESNLDEFEPSSYTKVTKPMAVGLLVNFWAVFKIAPVFVPNRDYGERVALRFLTAFFRHVVPQLDGRSVWNPGNIQDKADGRRR